MISAHEIRRQVALVATRKLSLNAFEDWFVSNSWNVHKESSTEAIDLVSLLQLLFSERDANILDESTIRSRLHALLNENPAPVENFHAAYSDGVEIRPLLATRRSLAHLVQARVIL